MVVPLDPKVVAVPLDVVLGYHFRAADRASKVVLKGFALEWMETKDEEGVRARSGYEEPFQRARSTEGQGPMAL